MATAFVAGVFADGGRLAAIKNDETLRVHQKQNLCGRLGANKWPVGVRVTGRAI